MNIDILRYSDNGESTLGLLFIKGEFQCYTLEDTYHKVKVHGETRIPSGRYPVKLRAEGGFHARYLKRFGRFHKGTLHVQDVPGFRYILIHTGNHRGHTKGCLLVGNTPNNNQAGVNGFLGESTKAYKRLYTRVVKALRTEKVFITYHDLDNSMKSPVFVDMIAGFSA